MIGPTAYRLIDAAGNSIIEFGVSDKLDSARPFYREREKLNALKVHSIPAMVGEF